MRVAFALISLVLLAGCARVEVRTAIRPDGSFDRVVHYKINSSGPAEGLQRPSKFSDFFELPHEGSGIVLSKEDTANEKVITSTRTIPAGAAPLSDLILIDSGKTSARNETLVRRLGDGSYEYVESIRWVGPLPNKTLTPTSLRADVKQALPEGSDTAKIDRVTKSMEAAMIRVLFGPPRPILGDLIVNQDLGDRLTRQRLYPEYDRLLTEEGSPSDRKAAFLSKFIHESLEKTLGGMTMDASLGGVTNAPTQKPQSSNGLVPLTFSVSVPGQVLSTNGEKDPITGEIYWALYPEAACLETVKLRVLFKP